MSAMTSPVHDSNLKQWLGRLFFIMASMMRLHLKKEKAPLHIFMKTKKKNKLKIKKMQNRR